MERRVRKRKIAGNIRWIQTSPVRGLWRKQQTVVHVNSVGSSRLVGQGAPDFGPCKDIHNTYRIYHQWIRDTWTLVTDHIIVLWLAGLPFLWFDVIAKSKEVNWIMAALTWCVPLPAHGLRFVKQLQRIRLPTKNRMMKPKNKMYASHHHLNYLPNRHTHKSNPTSCKSVK